MTPTNVEAPGVAATTPEGKKPARYFTSQEREGSLMNNSTEPLNWAISSTVTVAETADGPAVYITADAGLDKTQTRRLVRDLLQAQRFIEETFEPIPYALA